MLLLLIGFLIVPALVAELIISSFNQNGELTWTNSAATIATYRVEWASSATGPWSSFDSLTNLTVISATSNVVTVKVPMFYRVVWLDAPTATGIWNFSEFDMQGNLVVSGRLVVLAETNSVTGTWELQQPPGSTNYVGPQVGTGTLYGSLVGLNLFLQLGPGHGDELIELNGNLIGNRYTGSWYYCAFACARAGTFIAEKQPGSE